MSIIIETSYAARVPAIAFSWAIKTSRHTSEVETSQNQGRLGVVTRLAEPDIHKPCRHNYATRRQVDEADTKLGSFKRL